MSKETLNKTLTFNTNILKITMVFTHKTEQPKSPKTTKTTNNFQPVSNATDETLEIYSSSTLQWLESNYQVPLKFQNCQIKKLRLATFSAISR